MARIAAQKCCSYVCVFVRFTFSYTYTHLVYPVLVWLWLSSLCLSGRVFIIALFRLTRRVTVLRSKLPLTVSCPVVYGRAWLSAHSAKLSSSLPSMPPTNKLKNTMASKSSGVVQASAQETQSVSREVSLAASETEGKEDNIGDREIIKSPSDPKQYR